MFSFNLFKKSKSQTQKPSLEGVHLDIGHIQGAVEVVEGFPRVKWPQVQQAVRAYSQHPAIDQIWTELAVQWLGIIQCKLGDSYKIYESKHLLLLSAQLPGAAKHLLKIGDAACEHFGKLLQRRSHSPGSGKHVELILDTPTIYYDYISCFYPEAEREYGTSAGMHISSDGYRHTVVNGASSKPLRTLVHELAHNAVFDRPLPRWLNEGLANLRRTWCRIIARQSLMPGKLEFNSVIGLGLAWTISGMAERLDGLHPSA